MLPNISHIRFPIKRKEKQNASFQKFNRKIAFQMLLNSDFFLFLCSKSTFFFMISVGKIWRKRGPSQKKTNVCTFEPRSLPLSKTKQKQKGQVKAALKQGILWNLIKTRRWQWLEELFARQPGRTLTLQGLLAYSWSLQFENGVKRNHLRQEP